MPSSSEILRSRCASRSIRSEFRRSVVVSVALIAAAAVGFTGCRDDDGDAPVTPPPGGTTGTTVDPDEAAGTVVTPGTGLISIDGPATVDSSFGAASQNQGGG
jgi:hypothetical protein